MGAAALTYYYALFVVILMNGRVLLTDYAVFVQNITIQLAIASGWLIVYATTARIDAAGRAAYAPGSAGLWCACTNASEAKATIRKPLLPSMLRLNKDNAYEEGHRGIRDYFW